MRPLIFSLLCLFLQFTSFAQTSLGTQFWLAYMENLTLEFNDAPRFAVQVEAMQDTEGNIVVPSTGLSIPFSLAANTVSEVFLPEALWYTLGSEIIDNKGISVETNNPVRLSAIHYRAYFSESTQVLPFGELGEEYIVTCYEDDNGSDPSSFVVVSTTNGTTVEITPSTLTLGLRPAGVPFEVELDEGQSYQVQAAGDLSGTRIRSIGSAPIAVFSGARQADVQICQGGADSHIYDQAFPLDSWGTLYHVVPFKSQGNDVIKAVAQQDATKVYINCTEVAELDAGEFYQTQLTNAIVVSATAPVALSQFSTSAGCSNSALIGDPNMMRLVPAGYQGEFVRFLSSGLFNAFIGANYFTEHYVNIILPTSGIGGVSLDNALVASSEFQSFPGNAAYAYAQLDLSAGEHLINSLVPFQAYSYGFGNFDAYTTRLGYNEAVDVPYACLDIDVEGVFCVDSLLQFSYASTQEVAQQFWNFGELGTSTSAAPSFIFTETGSYEVILTLETTAGSMLSDTLQIEILECEADICDTPQDITLFSEETYCLNTPFELSFEFTGILASAEWIFDNGITVNEIQPAIQFPAAGTYNFVLVVTDIFNCMYETSGSFEVLDCGPCPPGETDIQFEGLPCKDSLITFLLPFDPVANPPLFIEWNINGIISNEPFPSIAFAQAGNIVVSLQAIDFQDCLYEGSLDIEIIDCEINPCIGLPPLDIDFMEPVCIDSLVLFTATTEAELVTFNWQNTNGATSNEEFFITSFEEEEVFTVELSALDAQGCSYSAGVDIVPEGCEGSDCTGTVQIEADSSVVCADSLVQFFASGPANLIDYNWQFSNGNTSDEEAPAVAFTRGTIQISLEVFASDGCFYEDEIQLEVVECLLPKECFYNFPNVFTPNNDGDNDQFSLLYTCPASAYSLIIYNRWGEQVFATDDFTQGWDGTYNGKAAPTEVYAYLAILEDNQGQEQRFQGTLTLIR